jgi:type IV pilus assembly protein PilB
MGVDFMTDKTNKKIGEILIEDGLIQPAQLAEALEYQKQNGGLVGQILTEKRFLDEDSLVSALGKQAHMPYIPLCRYSLNPEMAALLKADFCNTNLVVAFDGDSRKVFLAVADPLDKETVEKVRAMTGRVPKVYISRISEILNAIFYLYHEKK